MTRKEIWIGFVGALAIAVAAFLVGTKYGKNTTEQTAADSMVTFMSAVSALGYLEKGDGRSAMLVLRDLAERNLITVDRLGNPLLENAKPGATKKWFADYAALRKKLPTQPNSVGGEDFDKKVDAILSAAVSDDSRQRSK